MLVPSPSSSCRIRWILNLSTTAATPHPHTHTHSHTLSGQPTADFDPFGQLPLSPLSTADPVTLIHATGGDPIVGGRLDGLSDEPASDDGGMGWEYESDFGGLEGAAAMAVLAASSEQKLRWRVEVQRPAMDREWQHLERA